jgi:hypothetical protein
VNQDNFALSALRPYFASKAIVILQVCKCGGAQTLSRRLSQVLGVPVMAWDADVNFEGGLLGKGVTYDPGNMLVCVSRMCATHANGVAIPLPPEE